MKTKKLIKKAFENPELFSSGELLYFNLWLSEKKKQKSAKINKGKRENS
jgi:hypothetical protein